MTTLTECGEIQRSRNGCASHSPQNAKFQDLTPITCLKDLSGKEGLYEVGKRQYCDVVELVTTQTAINAKHTFHSHSGCWSSRVMISFLVNCILPTVM